MTDAELRIVVLVGLQTALLGQISERLRAVICSWNSNLLSITAIFDGTLSESDAEGMSEVETEMISHLPDLQVTLQIKHLDVPSLIVLKRGEVFVFLRKELESGTVA
ncbi:hypothetical protein [Pseudovibrio sp. Tun.PSC04-5.I4]|uniref:hypothetical protein n=1 Tax=Pseudovibrio sp. Tun.PSC04-5.I4 TaxID=1798213 RepID=UPI00088EFC74|nr:hypothetical protein [Pseudovibrio sp. Tun.PSC04-5.I4]SDR45754.1 hypothetical protein SAMN04515695_5631 [Pseudovibrio sp. Tun.PSC04-5.I4]